MLDYLQDLNEEQRKAVEDTEGPSLVIAGAGSGKTRVLTFRIAHLMNLGKRPSSILALTFTNKAAREMKSRIASLTDPQLSNYLWMGTFHSIFSRILRIEHEAIGYPSDYTIYDTQDSRNLIKSIIKELKLDSNIYKPNEVQGRISWAKNNLITPAGYENHEEIQQQDNSRRKPFLSKIYRFYTKRCKQAGAMDFDDLLMQTNILFRDNKEIVAKYQHRFQYILVDEYQDTNYAQYLILKKLAERHNNICVVGDDAQSIYAFRGARIENILNFKNDYPDHRIYKLERNYRSTQNIVNAANSVIAKNEQQIPKNVFSKKDLGTKIKVQPTLTDIEEGYWVVDDIHQKHYQDHDPFSDFAILYRTNSQSRIFEDALRKKNIPYKIYGGLSFYQRKEIKDLLAYLRIVVNPNDDEALKRIINYPKRGIGETTVTRLQQQAFGADLSIWDVMNSAQMEQIQLNKRAINQLGEFAKMLRHFQDYLHEDAYNAAKKIASETGILKELYKDKSPEGISRHENIQELLNGIYDFVNQRKKAQAADPAQDEENPREYTLEHYLENVALLTSQDQEDEEDFNKVTLMTIHSAKGLEFKNLYIVGLEEELFPSKMASDTTRELEEERRLFYVALTRAEKRLTLTYCKQRFKWGSMIPSTPSRFVRDIEASFLDMPDEMEDYPQMKSSGGTRYVRHRTAKQNDSKTDVKANKERNHDITAEIKKGKYKKVSNASAETTGNTRDFNLLKEEDLEPGSRIEHSRFGKGEVLELNGTYPHTKALIQFEQKGKKQLLLKFARLKILD